MNVRDSKIASLKLLNNKMIKLKTSSKTQPKLNNFLANLIYGKKMNKGRTVKNLRKKAMIFLNKKLYSISRILKI